MAAPNKFFSQFISLVKSWIPWRSEPPNVSRDFWMPDDSCRVCYECDAQFTVFNRKHHCRLCGRVFCAKCTENSIPPPSIDRVERERIRVCNFCYKQHEQGIASTHENGTQIANLDLSTSPSETSFTSFKSCGTGNSSSFTLNSVPYSTGPYQRLQNSSGLSPCQSSLMGTITEKHSKYASWRTNDFVADIADSSPNHYEISTTRSDDEDVDYGTYQSNSKNYPQVSDYYDHVEFYDMSNHDESHKVDIDGGNIDAKHLSSSPLLHSFDSQGSDEIPPLEKKEDEHDMGDECASSLCSAGDVDIESLDFEKNALLWLPPEPEDEEDERETVLLDDDDDGDAAGEWGTLRASSSFGSGESRNRDRSGEEHKKVMKNVVDGHFRALVAQLLQVENLPVGQEGENESWLEIITYLSWEAATLLKPDMSKGGGMDPGGYVKVKCIASGRPSDSMVVKGVVCKKNVAHRRMASKMEKPRFMILGGALEYQRVSNLLSSFDTLLQQEMDHLKMAVAKIEAHHPDVLLVEKSVSRYAQEYLLAKDISLVLNIKRSLLERIARCTGAQIVPSIDHLSSQKLGYCDTFHVERFLEDLGSAGQGGKKLVKTLMYFEGCPKPLGCTILLRGANGDELKKVKHVVQYGVFAAYHLALETSFLADEGASLPELPFQSPITVALPDKPSSIERSISTVPGFKIDANGTSQGAQHQNEPIRANSVPVSDFESAVRSRPPCLLTGRSSLPVRLTSSSTDYTRLHSAAPGNGVSFHIGDNQNEMDSKDSWVVETSASKPGSDIMSNHLTANSMGSSETMGQGVLSNTQNDPSVNQLGSSNNPTMHQDGQTHAADSGTMNEEFPPSPADHQSILVSLSSRCVWKGTVCERSHLFRIKYYGSFDKPLGRFLRDHLFDQTYQCHSCEMPSEAHVHCYTHRQGTLTISVKRLPEIFLPGEREGKIWMWHRCLRCPRISGFPPATRRIVMSDAAWGLSFGKFLELSFSNHAAASRVASCGHSLHRDCLRFYGFGKMVACFRYASIDVHSVYLPPSKLDFISKKQEWIQKETNEVVDRAELLFSEVLNALRQIVEKRSGSGSITSGILTAESRHQIVELEGMLQKEKVEFEELLQKTLTREPKKGQPVIDILEINRLRRQLFFQSYMWDHRLVYAASLDNNSFQDSLSSSIPAEEKPMATNEKLAGMDVERKPGKGYNSCDSYLVDTLLRDGFDHDGGFTSPAINADMVHAAHVDMNNDLNKDKGQANLPTSTSVGAQFAPLTPRTGHRRVLSDGELPRMLNLSDTLETAWTGENLMKGVKARENTCPVPVVPVENSSNASSVEGLNLNHAEARNGTKVAHHVSPALSTKGSENMEDRARWLKMPFLNFYWSLNKNFLSAAQKFDTLGEYNPVYISSFRELELEGGARLLLPVGDNDTVVPVYDDEPASLIAYALVSSDYKLQTSDEGERAKDNGDVVATVSFTDSVIMHPDDDTVSETHRSLGSTEESILSMSGSRGSLGLDPLSYTKALHARVSFGDDGPLGQVKYSVTCYYAKRFEALRKMCCPSELDFVRSLGRCKKWGAQGGKSNVFFAKTLDDRFIIKQVTKTELESFIKFAPAYFKYLSDSISTGSPTCLAKILGIYQVTSKHVKGGKETKMDVLIMENLLFGRTVTRVYDLKGSSRSRYNPDSSGSNKVLLDQNLIEAMPTSPIFVGNKAKRLLERAVWNDTAFLASIDVMDYSLLVGVDEEKHELVLGIIDFMRQYTWDKHLETWVKASGILGGPKNASPTVISPKQYKKRFRKAMTTYFLMVPDQWSPPCIVPSTSQSDFGEEAAHGGTSVE
ncbi:PREDICTED: 1-phosphatidylinositol-3-phosphate 5-kinase FAB1B [Fragaria vesca subsp. vesca]|uniref:1-phosphatidylinositol-3-phosphate 5-kinase FAB1B n=1 Tax=Fragaria vesca subsp. vesca TaxID=101020 RepID=UPI0002C35318|nr:PREDICTED: 1-phosphatidylinositol-3-phosphate 5-kinase FAB1B [Fragaria vesca subsp. vesca]XP_011467487.1 PREDICTED: 1-phosphatidylinositol-3-phosphate 5-kinase FAB1B [Fragaria vesca subsp. vesca]